MAKALEEVASTSASASDDGEEFFETMEDIASTSGSDSASSDGEHLAARLKQRNKHRQQLDQALPDSKYAVWRTDPASIGERRLRLFQKMGLDELVNERSSALVRSCRSFPSFSASPHVIRSISDPYPGEQLRSQYAIWNSTTEQNSVRGFEVSKDDGNEVDADVAFSSTDSPASSIPRDGGSRRKKKKETSFNVHSGQNENADDQRSSTNSNNEFVCRIKDLDNGKEFVVHELGSDGLWNKLREVGTGKEFSLEEFESSLGLSPIVQQLRRIDRENGQRLTAPGEAKQKRKSWLRGIRGVVKRSPTDGGLKDNSRNHHTGTSPWKMQRIKVRICKKALRELTELYMGQEIDAHQGPIWALKFSSGGRYLASGGQDCVVRVWEVVSSSNQNATIDGAEGNPEPVSAFKQRRSEKRRNSSGRKKCLDDDRLGLKTFGLLDKAVCCLYGHTEDILDLSWSASQQFLLSSSMDTTVRLWHVARQECLRIFSHNDYVTCIVFNPVDETYFLSGSLDGKVRIWSILEHHVIDWTDLREIVTAASYTPDGTVAMIGSYKGICRFYNTTGNKLQLRNHIDVVSKKGKKFRGKKITGIQCMPGDSSKILITSNDSRIRLYESTDLISKYKGFRNMSSQISASFSRNGSFIISASEDSHVYTWNVLPPSSSTCRGHLKISEKSCESFFSDNVTVAVPWSADKEGKDVNDLERRRDERRALKVGGDILQLLKQSSFPGPCFDCLSMADSVDGGTSVFPVNDNVVPDDVSACGSVADSLGVDLGISPASTYGLASLDSLSKCSATFPEEKLLHDQGSLVPEETSYTGGTHKEAARGLGLVIVTASLSGEIRTFQNYGLPLHA